MNPTSSDTVFDTVVVGGGPAGLAGAVALARSRRTVLVVDAGRPRNAPAGHVHNYLGREGVTPAELTASGRAEVELYGGQVRAGHVVSAARRPGGFTLTLDDGSQVDARRLLVTTGAVDVLPDVPGLAQRWGSDVLHCPYCHGWEVRDRAIGVLVSTPVAAHQALLFRQLSDDVTVFLDGTSLLGEADLERLVARGITIVGDKVAEVVVEDDRLVGVRLEGGEVVPRDALTVASYVEVGSPLLDSLGLVAEPFEVGGVALATAVTVDATGRTAVPGVWAAGNVTTPMAQVVSSAAAGLAAGAMINADLVEEETAAAVAGMQEAS